MHVAHADAVLNFKTEVRRRIKNLSNSDRRRVIAIMSSQLIYSTLVIERWFDEQASPEEKKHQLVFDTIDSVKKQLKIN